MQTYVLEFGDKYIRFYAEGGQVVKGTPAAPYEISTPYAEDDLFEINYTQSADVLYLTHPTTLRTSCPGGITRTGLWRP